MGGQPGAVVLLGDHCIMLGLQGAAFRRDGVLGIQEHDGALKVAAVVAKLEGCERVQWVLGLVYCRGLL
jgi:hypothetical protein